MSEAIFSPPHLARLVDLIEKALLLYRNSNVVRDGGETKLAYDDGLLFSYSGFVGFMNAMGGKILAACDSNPQRGLPYIVATTVLCNVPDGRPLALIDGGLLTAIRTACLSALATRCCAKPGPTAIGVFGYGLQAKTHILALKELGYRKAYVLGRDQAKARDFAVLICDRYGIGIEVVENSSDLLQQTDVVVTATRSKTPLFNANQLRPGMHINVIGPFWPERQEVDKDVFRTARVVVDTKEKFLRLWPQAIVEFGRVAELGEVIEGLGIRNTPCDITLFHPLGMGILDVLAAKYVYDNGLLV